VLDGIHHKYIPYELLVNEGKHENLKKIPYFDLDPKNDSFVLTYSSGTTGIPKCAILSHYMIVSILAENFNNMRFKGLTVSVNYPFGHVSGSIYLPSLTISGSILVLFEEYDEHLILKSVEKYKINAMSLFTAFCRKLIEGELVDKYDLSQTYFYGRSSFSWKFRESYYREI